MSPSGTEMVEPGLGRPRDRIRIPERRVAPIVDLGRHSGHPLGERHHRPPAELRPDLADIRPGTIRLAGTLRYVDDLAADQFDQAVHGLRIAGAEIPYLPDMRRLGRRQKGARYVARIEEVATLRAVSHHGERLPGQLLLEEHAEDSAIGAGRPHPSAIRVEDADRVD